MLQRYSTSRWVLQRTFRKFWGSTSKETNNSPMSPQEREALKEKGPLVVLKDELSERKGLDLYNEIAKRELLDEQGAMDKIRARGIMPFNYNYDPPKNLTEIFASVAKNNELQVDDKKFPNLSAKSKVLLELGKQLNHYVPSSKLLYVESMEDALQFYQKSVRNTTDYAQMARNSDLPANLTVNEHPTRFHPNDTDAVHKGITAYPGTGGKIFGLRNKRIYRQYRPKQDWFDYEEQKFDHERPDRNNPWDKEMAAKMDRYTDRKVRKNEFGKF
ncbi:39S ribosomal protein L50, mitochondrial [Aphelenchoides besseyi]|nr:39S ribosomal protein L50, mitochondrial [Aphelenchoides besseyi]